MQLQLQTLCRGGAIALLAVIAATGCVGRSGTGDVPAAGDAGSSTQAGGGTTTSQGGTATSGGATTSTVGGADESADTLADGRHPARIVAISTTKKTVRFDVIQFLTGQAANQAAAEDGEETPVANDYYIRNTNPRLRTLTVAPSLTVVVNVLAATETGSATKDTRISLAKLASYPPGRVDDTVFWLTVGHGKITRIEEQFLP